jgi:hypothetical protein
MPAGSGLATGSVRAAGPSAAASPAGAKLEAAGHWKIAQEKLESAIWVRNPRKRFTA